MWIGGTSWIVFGTYLLICKWKHGRRDIGPCLAVSLLKPKCWITSFLLFHSNSMQIALTGSQLTPLYQLRKPGTWRMQLLFSKVKSSRAAVDNTPKCSFFLCWLWRKPGFFSFYCTCIFTKKHFIPFMKKNKQCSQLPNWNILVKEFNTLDWQDSGDLMWKNTTRQWWQKGSLTAYWLKMAFTPGGKE